MAKKGEKTSRASRLGFSPKPLTDLEWERVRRHPSRKPCGICGGEPRLTLPGLACRVQCRSCGLCSCLSDNHETAWAWWDFVTDGLRLADDVEAADDRRESA